jgi:hypothetical protein
MHDSSFSQRPQVVDRGAILRGLLSSSVTHL